MKYLTKVTVEQLVDTIHFFPQKILSIYCVPAMVQATPARRSLHLGGEKDPGSSGKLPHPQDLMK